MAQACRMEPAISHRDVTTVMSLLVDVRDELRTIRTLLEDADEEEGPEAEA